MTGVRPILALLLALGVAGWFAASRPPSHVGHTVPGGLASLNLNRIPPVVRGSSEWAPPAVRNVASQMDITNWAIPFGREFWRADRMGLVQASNGISSQCINDAVDRVTHSFIAGEGEARVAFRGGDARVCPAGLRFIHKEGGPDPALAPVFRTVSCTVSGSRDSQVLHALQSPWHRCGNTAQRRVSLAPDVIEHLEANRDGVRMTWVLPEAPPPGEFVIEAQVENARLVSRDKGGHRFVSLDGRTALQVGDVEVVDSRGERWSMPMDYEDGALLVRVPESVMREAVYPLAIDPLISPEFELGAPLEAGSPSTRFAPSIASSDTGYLVAWTQSAGETVPPGVFAVRLDAQGQLLDPYAIHLSQVSEQSKCAVAALRDLYLVVWASLRPGSTTEWDIFGTRVLLDGTVLDRPARVVCGINGHQSSPAVAASGTNFLVAWRDVRGSGIFANLVETNGNLLVPQGFLICSALNEQFTPAVASLNGDYLVVWEDYRSAASGRLHADIYGARVTGAGRVMDTNGFAICTLTNAQYAPAVAGRGSNYLVVWEDYSPTGNDIEGTRVSLSGVVLDNPPIQIAPLSNTQFAPSVAPGESGFFVAWQDYSLSVSNRYQASIRGHFVDDHGVVLAPEPQTFSQVTGQIARPAMASLNGGLSVVWQDDRRNPGTMLSDVYGYTEGATVPPNVQNRLLSKAANPELTPAVANDGTNYLVVWADARNSLTQGWDILGLRLGPEGALLDPYPISVCTNLNEQTDPVIAASDYGFLVAWADWRLTPSNVLQSDIYGIVVANDGTLPVSGAFPICTATNDQTLPAMVTLGTNYLVVWQDARSNTIPSGGDIFGARVTGAGQVLEPLGIPVCTNRANQFAPVVASFADKALVVWTDFRNNPAAGDIFAARITESGSVDDRTGLPLCTAGGPQGAPAVAAGLQGCFVAWADARSGAAMGSDIYGTFVTWDGRITPTNGVPLRSAPGAQSAPTVVFNGLDFLIAWQEPQSGITNFFDLYATGANADGSLWGGAPIALSLSAENQDLPVAGSGQNANVVLLNQTFRYSASRVTGRVLQLSAIPRLSVPRVQNGRASLVIRGAPGAQYQVEASGDLTTWHSLATFLMTNSPAEILDASAATNSVRFYRATLLQ